MARPLRIWYPGALYHIVARGNNREPIFLAPEDYRAYLQRLKEAKRRYGYRLHAYALMTNHVHLMLETAEVPPWTVMQSVNTAYTMRMNRKYGRVGHVFQGRYKSILVEQDAYALELSRYIHLNPVKARLCRQPEEYLWSSYRAYLGVEAPSDRFVDTELILSLCHPPAPGQLTTFQQFTMDGLRNPRELEHEVTASQFLGSATFVERITASAQGQT